MTEAKVITDRDTGRSRGFGFVTFANDNDCANAINAMNGANLDGRELRVNPAKPREGDQSFSNQQKEWTPKVVFSGENNPKVFVGNISFDVDDDQIKDFDFGTDYTASRTPPRTRKWTLTWGRRSLWVMGLATSSW